jgi:uncharacterized membrane protein
MIVWADVVEIAPELSTVTLAVQTTVLAVISETVSPETFCGSDTALYKLAASNLAAHYATTLKNANDSDGGQQGPVASESVGGLSVSYAGGFSGANKSRAGYETTGYGAAYLMLLRTSPCAGFGIMVI